ncbi:unnamed protein product, partial [Adineta steineri]
MSTFNNRLEPVAIVGIACEFAGDIHCANDLWYTLKESRDVVNAEPANIDPCHRSLILKFVDLLDGDAYFLQHSFIGAQSPGGRSPSFSVDANSYAKGDGLGLLLLKQLSDAERDGDPIEANCLDRFFNRSNLDPPLLLDLI